MKIQKTHVVCKQNILSPRKSKNIFYLKLENAFKARNVGVIKKMTNLLNTNFYDSGTLFKEFKYVCKQKYTHIVKYLLSKYYEDRKYSFRNVINKCYINACAMGNLDMVNCLYDVAYHAYDDYTGWKAFTVACKNGHIKVIEYFIIRDPHKHLYEQMANTYANGYKQACLNSHYDIIDCLLNMEKIYKLDWCVDEYSGFYAVCNQGNIKVINYLLNKTNSHYKLDGIKVASKNGNFDVVKCIFDSLTEEEKKKHKKDIEKAYHSANLIDDYDIMFYLEPYIK